MKRVYNFAAGPATLPEEVLKKAQEEILDYQDSGMSVMEMSHRSKLYDDIHNGAKEDLKKLLGLGEDYDLLFLQGGGSTQFDLIPLNFLGEGQKAAFIDTGSWTSKAIKEAEKFGEVEVLASSKDKAYTYLPAFDGMVPEKAAYLYICTNNTIYGTAYREEKIPKVDLPLIADMSSNILGEAYDYRAFDLFFAGAQKNLGPAGVTLVGIKKTLLEKAKEDLPNMFSYKVQAKKNSLYNTPPTYTIYILGLVAKWLLAHDGGREILKENKKKAAYLYDFIDQSKLYQNPVKKEDRSLMNVVFTTGDEKKDLAFVKEAEKEGLVNLKGHRSVGGMRASIYNAMTFEGVKALVDFMEDFERKN